MTQKQEEVIEDIKLINSDCVLVEELVANGGVVVLKFRNAPGEADRRVVTYRVDLDGRARFFA